MLASYIGFLVRQHIPITCDNWRSPDLKVGKEKIWSEIQRSFHIDESRQKYCIQLAGKRLRGFRSFLSNKFLKDEEGKFVEAERPMKYAEIISADEWDNFVAKRRNEKFHVMSINYGIIQLLSYLVLICLKLFYPGIKSGRSTSAAK
ncbi:uncharacterized protein LOC127123886 [Lathyrus oleraceus]|uniref:uncharacterized protein LOC127123886 n=1 Tax=Pisum sativum TaxID=3888 RepID=UPI0021D17579|nr:uncharacterized protein LOC127123886 [Pisum sativum]